MTNLTDAQHDHFGEISLIYECKRTCNVISQNYCTLATLSRSNFMDIKRQHFDQLENRFKDHILHYEDEVKLFIEYELNKIDYFKGLSLDTKQDWIFSMERISYSKDSYVCTRNELVDKMVLI